MGQYFAVMYKILPENEQKHTKKFKMAEMACKGRRVHECSGLLYELMSLREDT